MANSSSAKIVARALVLAFSALCALAVVGCGDDDEGPHDECRFDPARCGGGPGGNCVSDRDCGTELCCKDPKHCGGGMCTYSCKSDLDCPGDMGCEHGVCFFLCRSNADCAVGQECAHDHTVCEWK